MIFFNRKKKILKLNKEVNGIKKEKIKKKNGKGGDITMRKVYSTK